MAVGQGEHAGSDGQVLPHDGDGEGDVRSAGAVLPTTVRLNDLDFFNSEKEGEMGGGNQLAN